MPEDKRRLPPWLVGLIIAALLFVVGFLVAGALGFGDDPVLGSTSDGRSRGTETELHPEAVLGASLEQEIREALGQ